MAWLWRFTLAHCSQEWLRESFVGGVGFFQVLKKNQLWLYVDLDLLPTVLWDVKASIFDPFAISLLKESN